MPGMDGTGPMGSGPHDRRTPRAVRWVSPTPFPPAAGWATAAAGAGTATSTTQQGSRAGSVLRWTRLPDVTPAPQDDRMQRLEQRLDEALSRLARLEGTE